MSLKNCPNIKVFRKLIGDCEWLAIVRRLIGNNRQLADEIIIHLCTGGTFSVTHVCIFSRGQTKCVREATPSL